MGLWWRIFLIVTVTIGAMTAWSLFPLTARAQEVTDFRDLWVRFPGRKPLSPVRGWLERRIERNIMPHADRIIANTESSPKSLLQD